MPKASSFWHLALADWLGGFRSLPWRWFLLIGVGIITAALLRVVLARPRRGSVVWVAAILAAALSSPAFVCAPKGVAADNTPFKAWQKELDRLELPTAGVAGAVAFLMHFGMQGAAHQDPAVMMQHYPNSGPAPAIEQRIAGDYTGAPLDFHEAQQQLSARFSQPRQLGQRYSDYADQPGMEKYDPSMQRRQLRPLEASAAEPAAEAERQVAEPGHLRYAEVRQALEDETAILRSSVDRLAYLEANLQSAKVQSDLKEAAAISESLQGSQAGSIHDLLLVAFGAVMGAAGFCIQRISNGHEFPEEPRLAAGAVGLAFSTAVFTSSPALSSAPLNPETVSSTMPGAPVAAIQQQEPMPSERPLRAAVPRPQLTSFSTRVPTISARPTLLGGYERPASAPAEQKAVPEPYNITAMALRPQPLPAPRSPQLAASRQALARLSPARGAALAPGGARNPGLTLWPQNQWRSSRPRAELGEY